MMTESARPHSQKNRELLESAVEARLQYAGYLLAVTNGERPADPEEKERLKSRCEEALDACRAAHLAWSGNSWTGAEKR